MSVEFGLGLIGIGKPWGYRNPAVPDAAGAVSLLEHAFEIGVRYYDTAPSYGVSEERLGRFLRSLTASDRDLLTISTKFGEHWDADRREPLIDHSLTALRRSLDASLASLGRIDVLQLHKTTPEVLRSADLALAWDYASSLGIKVIGASVSDAESAQIVIEDPRYVLIQLPYNSMSPGFGQWIDSAAGRGMRVAVNRPFAMGKALYEQPDQSKEAAFRFILQRNFDGVILSGTKSPWHLEENWRAFAAARSS